MVQENNQQGCSGQYGDGRVKNRSKVRGNCEQNIKPKWAHKNSSSTPKSKVEGLVFDCYDHK